MSSYDNSQDDFIPFDIGQIQKFDEEVSQKQEGLDVNEFKTLFAGAVFDSASSDSGEDSESFPLLHGNVGKRKEEEEPFALLFDKGVKKEEQETSASADSAEMDEVLPLDEEVEAFEEEAEPQIPIEEQAREEGYQAGLAQGQAEGLEKGYQEGFAKGEQEGFASGEKQGYDEGFQKGQEEGQATGEQEGRETARNEARQEIQDSLDTLKNALEEVHSLTDSMVDRNETKLVELVLKIAKKVVGVTIDSDDEVVKRTVLEALKTLVNPEEVVLSVSPEDYSYIEMVRDDFFQEISSLQSVSVQSDSLVNRGGCRIETRTGTVTSDPEEKMKAIEEALLAYHNNP